jgi:hypothetical protein
LEKKETQKGCDDTIFSAGERKSWVSNGAIRIVK